MAVTELALLTAIETPLTDEAKKATIQALDVQEEWRIKDAPKAPRGKETRGVGLFQQTEDRSIYLLTAHWDSYEHHTAWIKSPENGSVYPGLKNHFQLEKTVLSHLENVELFKTSGAEGEISLLHSPVISVGKLTIPTEKRRSFEQGWSEAKDVLEKFVKPHLVRDGWRIEKEEPGLEEYVFACGWPSLEKSAEFATSQDFQKYSPVIFSTQARDIKHYQRVL
ncbi:uncharacterized protein F4822DRAFT_187183 [Hypoxylon trugodes]|uniref:uncharacterized protein n=1 Tax=Hypoxylon trugodes TaxID=326681 RepID=UPI00219DB78A|nr:uncharacterized protein F4822DRAFT_187183 [Hypoxylon trugodes]KAI1391487.1 hypothetical protein F4822DRAFT_187183 [Hypoxylon trugodes]